MPNDVYYTDWKYIKVDFLYSYPGRLVNNDYFDKLFIN